MIIKKFFRLSLCLMSIFSANHLLGAARGSLRDTEEFRAVVALGFSPEVIEAEIHTVLTRTFPAEETRENQINVLKCLGIQGSGNLAFGFSWFDSNEEAARSSDALSYSLDPRLNAEWLALMGSHATRVTKTTSARYGKVGLTSGDVYRIIDERNALLRRKLPASTPAPAPARAAVPFTRPLRLNILEEELKNHGISEEAARAQISALEGKLRDLHSHMSFNGAANIISQRVLVDKDGTLVLADDHFCEELGLPALARPAREARAVIVDAEPATAAPAPAPAPAPAASPLKNLAPMPLVISYAAPEEATDGTHHELTNHLNVISIPLPEPAPAPVPAPSAAAPASARPHAYRPIALLPAIEEDHESELFDEDAHSSEASSPVSPRSAQPDPFSEPAPAPAPALTAMASEGARQHAHSPMPPFPAIDEDNESELSDEDDFHSVVSSPVSPRSPNADSTAADDGHDSPVHSEDEDKDQPKVHPIAPRGRSNSLPLPKKENPEAKPTRRKSLGATPSDSSKIAPLAPLKPAPKPHAPKSPVVDEKKISLVPALVGSTLLATEAVAFVALSLKKWNALPASVRSNHRSFISYLKKRAVKFNARKHAGDYLKIAAVATVIGASYWQFTQAA